MEYEVKMVDVDHSAVKTFIVESKGEGCLPAIPLLAKQVLKITNARGSPHRVWHQKDRMVNP